MLAYHFREGAKVTTSKKSATKMTKYEDDVLVTTSKKSATKMVTDAVLKYNNNPVTKLEFDYNATIEDSPYYYKDGTVIIKGVLIPRPGAFDLNKDDKTDNKLYATQSGIQFIMKNAPTWVFAQKAQNAFEF
jgi:hypothetical protein